MNEPSEEEKEDHKIVELRLVQGGKTNPPAGSWLRAFGDGGIFYAKRRKPLEGEDPCKAYQFHVFMMWENTAVLELTLWDSDMLRDRVFRHPYAIDLFSKEWELLDIVHEGQRDRTDLTDRLDQPEEPDGEKRDTGLDENSR